MGKKVINIKAQCVGCKVNCVCEIELSPEENETDARKAFVENAKCPECGGGLIEAKTVVIKKFFNCLDCGKTLEYQAEYFASDIEDGAVLKEDIACPECGSSNLEEMQGDSEIEKPNSKFNGYSELPKDIEEKFFEEIVPLIEGESRIAKEDLIKRGYSDELIKKLEALGYIVWTEFDDIFILMLGRKGVEKLSERQFQKELKQIIIDNPGIVQRDLVKQGYDSIVFWYLEKLGCIRREKFKNSYKLFVIEDNSKQNRKLLLRDWSERTQIPIHYYDNSLKQICDYFGKKLLEELFHVSVLRNYVHNFNDFCFRIGMSLRFDINEQLNNILTQYWTKECSNALKDFYSRYGFFSAETFVNSELEKILGRDSSIDFYAALEEQAEFFELRMCGAEIENQKEICIAEVSFDSEGDVISSNNLSSFPFSPSYTTSKNIPIYFAKHLLFRWGLKPESVSKKCKECGHNFYPFDYLDNVNLYQKIKKYRFKESIAELEFCEKHL